MGRLLPISKLTMPSSLKNERNGFLSPRVLAPIHVGNAVMERTAARSFIAMFADAKRQIGLTVKEVGDYRPFQEQLNLFLLRYQPVKMAQYMVTPPAHRKKWDAALDYGHGSVYWAKKMNKDGTYPATAATPGASNHGWGLALDIAEEYDSDSAPDPIRSIFVGWLCENANRYGISAELQSEPWHWRYVAGDKIPFATLDYEQGNVGTVDPLFVKPNPAPALVFAYPGSPLSYGSQGDAVKLVQAFVGARADGDFGEATERRVKIWQKANGLLDDGIVGRVTWKKMFG